MKIEICDYWQWSYSCMWDPQSQEFVNTGAQASLYVHWYCNIFLGFSHHLRSQIMLKRGEEWVLGNYLRRSSKLLLSYVLPCSSCPRKIKCVRWQSLRKGHTFCSILHTIKYWICKEVLVKCPNDHHKIRTMCS